MIKKSVILVFAFILFYSFSVSAELVKEANGEKVIADYLAFEKEQESKEQGLVRSLSLSSSPQIVITSQSTNDFAHYTDKYKPLVVYRRGEKVYTRRTMQYFSPTRNMYYSNWTDPNGNELLADKWKCWFDSSLWGVICDAEFTIPEEARVGTYIIERAVHDKETGRLIQSFPIRKNYVIFNPFREDKSLAEVRAYAYDPYTSKGAGKDETGIWFTTWEHRTRLLYGNWLGDDYGQKFTLHPYDTNVFLNAISLVEGENSAENAANKLRVYTSFYLKPIDQATHYDTNELRVYNTPAHCASKANFLVEALRSVGIPSRPVSLDGNEGWTWNFHTWTEAWFGGEWYVLDAYLGKNVNNRRKFVTLNPKYMKEINDLILVAKPDWSSGELGGIFPSGADVKFKYVPGNDAGERPKCSVPAQNLDYKAGWIEELSQAYWGENMPYWQYNRLCTSPEPYNITVTIDKESYDVGETMLIIVNVFSNLDVFSTPLVRGEVLEQIPFMKVPVEKTLYSFERNVDLPAYESYQLVEYYNVSEDVITTDSFNIVVSAENVSTISFFDTKPLVSLNVEAPTTISKNESFTVGVRVSNNHTITLSNIEVAVERLPYNLYTEDSFVKTVPSLLPGQSELLTWSMVGVSPGDAELIFNVSSENGGADKIGALISVKDYPELLMNLSNPSSAGIGEKFGVIAEIFNVGGLTAKGVTITLVLPPELSTSESLTKSVGDISAQSSTSVSWSVKASKEGVYLIEADASDVTGLYKIETLSPIDVIKKSPYELKLEALNELKGLRTGKSCSRLFWWLDKGCVYEHRIDKAIYYLEQSLNRAYWIDDYTLNSKYGLRVFNYEKAAVNHLMKIKTSEAVELSEQLAFDQYEEVKEDEE